MPNSNLLTDEFLRKTGRFIYNIALRMLWHPADAEDATQEILIKVLNNIRKFKGKSKIETWIYRIAINHLLKLKKKRFRELSFDEFAMDLDRDYYTIPLEMNKAEEDLYIQELKIGCTHALLQCLDQKHRIVFILTSIFGMNSQEGSEILNIQPATYRKQLSRAMEKLRSFMHSECGLLNPSAKCNCRRRIPIAIEKKRIDKNNWLFIEDNVFTIREFTQQVEKLDEISQIYMSHPYYQLKLSTAKKLKLILRDPAFSLIRAE